jgi:hypothetical protein
MIHDEPSTSPSLPTRFTLVRAGRSWQSRRMRFSVAPSEVHVLTSNGFYLTVEGTGFGLLRCSSEGRRITTRWVFGAFREMFLLPNPRTTPAAIVVDGLGLGGRQRVVVDVRVQARLRDKPLRRRPLVFPAVKRPRFRRASPGNLSAKLTERWHRFLVERG